VILEQVAIDFRCRGCSNIRRLDAELHKPVADQLPEGWILEGLGVSCARCAGSPESPTPKQKADEKREEVRKLRMQTAEITSLESPITATASPLVSDKCSRCNLEIGEMESWRPDSLANGFRKAHRTCLDNALTKGI
jgi:hypothetical protein